MTRHVLWGVFAMLLLVHVAAAKDRLTNLPGYRRPLGLGDVSDLLQGVIDCSQDVLKSGSVTPTAVTAYNKQWLISLSSPDPPFKVDPDYRCLHVRITDVSHGFTVLPPACLVEDVWRTYGSGDQPIRWATARKIDDITVGNGAPQPFACGNLISMMPARSKQPA
jgi:hypothetical protein